jgi:hypothetical protein
MPGLFAAGLLVRLAGRADVVTGTVTPATAKAVVVDAKVIAELKVARTSCAGWPLRPGAGTEPREQEFLSLSEPVTVNVDCG